MNTWFKLKAETLKNANIPIRHGHIFLKTKQNIQSSHMYTMTRQHQAVFLHAHHFTPVYSSSSLSCNILRQPHLLRPHLPNIHYLLSSVWHRWHSHRQLKRGRMNWCVASACGSVMLHSTHPFFIVISARCALSTSRCPVFGFAVFLLWLFSTCCWSYCPHLSAQAEDNKPYSTVAAGNRATLWLPGLTQRTFDLFQLVSLRVDSQDGAWHVTLLAREI